MSNWPQGADWWRAADGGWYPPEQWTGPPGTSPPPRNQPEFAPGANGHGPMTVGTARPTGGSLSPAEVRVNRRLSVRPSRRFGGRGVLAVFGLLSILVTVAIMAVLSVKMLSGMDNTAAVAGLGTLATTVPGGPAAATSAPPAASPGPAALDASGAAAAVCGADRGTLETAVEAYKVLHGSVPPDMSALTADGLLSDPVTSFDYRVVDGEAVLEGRGNCVGR